MTADLTEFGRFHEFSCFDLGRGVANDANREAQYVV